jgi:hypothetical protein
LLPTKFSGCITPTARIEEEIAEAGRDLANEAENRASASANQGAIIKTSSIVDSPSAPPANTLLLFFFSGHGVQVDGLDYIVPRVSHDSLETPSNIARDTMAVPHLTDKLDDLAVASVIILDTDFPKLFHERSR